MQGEQLDYDYTDYPYLLFTGFGSNHVTPGEGYFSMPTSEYNDMFVKTVCVKNCPTAAGDQPECKPTSKNPVCEVANNPFL